MLLLSWLIAILVTESIAAIPAITINLLTQTRRVPIAALIAARNAHTDDAQLPSAATCAQS
jgi:hypothetical protein